MWELNITNIRGVIGINKHDAFLNIRQMKPEVEISTKGPEVNLTTTHLRVNIDQSRCFAEIGSKGIRDFMEQFAGAGREALFEFINAKAADGERFAAIQSSSDAVSQIAEAKALPPSAEINVKLIPTSRPDIDFVGGVSFNPVKGEVDVSLNRGITEFTADKPSVEVYMLNKPSFKFEFIGSYIDMIV